MQTAQMEKGIARIQHQLKGFASYLAAIGGTAAFAGIIRSGENFDRAMNSSTAIMGDLSESLRGDLRQAALDAAATTKFSSAEAAESLYFLASAGLSAEQSIAALPQAAQFAAAANADMATAVDLLTDSQSALGLTVKDTQQNMLNMKRVSDVFVKGSNLANSSVQQLSEAMTNKAGAALRLVNKSVEEGTAVLLAFADQNLKGAEGGTALGIVMRDLQTAAINNAKAFKDAGIAVYNDAGNMENLADIIGDVEEALEGMSDIQKKSTLMQLGFADKSVAYLQTLIGTSEKIKEYQKQLEAVGDITDEVANKQMTGFQRGLAQIESALTDVGSEITTFFGPALAGMLTGLAEGVRFLNEYANAGKALLKTIIILGSLKTAFMAVAAAEKAVAAATILVHSLAGPAAWAKMAAGLAIAAGAIAVLDSQMADAIATANQLDSAMPIAKGLGKPEELLGKGFKNRQPVKLPPSQIPEDVEPAIRGFEDLESAIKFVNDELEALKSPAEEYADYADKVREAYTLGLIDLEQHNSMLVSAAETAAQSINLTKTAIEDLPLAIQEAVEKMQKLNELNDLEKFADQIKQDIMDPLEKLTTDLEAQKTKLEKAFEAGFLSESELEKALAMAQSEFDQAKIALNPEMELPEQQQPQFAGAMDFNSEAARSVILSSRFGSGQDKGIDAVAKNTKDSVTESKKQTELLGQVVKNVGKKTFPLT